MLSCDFLPNLVSYGEFRSWLKEVGGFIKESNWVTEAIWVLCEEKARCRVANPKTIGSFENKLVAIDVKIMIFLYR